MIPRLGGVVGIGLCDTKFPPPPLAVMSQSIFYSPSLCSTAMIVLPSPTIPYIPLENPSCDSTKISGPIRVIMTNPLRG